MANGNLTNSIIQSLPKFEERDPTFPSPGLQLPNFASLPTGPEAQEIPLGVRIARAIALIGGGLANDPSAVPQLLSQFQAEDRAAKAEAQQRFANAFTLVQAQNQAKLREFELQESQVAKAEARTEAERQRKREETEDVRKAKEFEQRTTLTNLKIRAMQQAIEQTARDAKNAQDPETQALLEAAQRQLEFEFKEMKREQDIALRFEQPGESLTDQAGLTQPAGISAERLAEIMAVGPKRLKRLKAIIDRVPEGPARDEVIGDASALFSLEAWQVNPQVVGTSARRLAS